MNDFFKAVVIVGIITGFFFTCMLVAGCDDSWDAALIKSYHAERAIFEDEDLDTTISEIRELYKIRKQFELLNRQLAEQQGCENDYSIGDE